MTFRNENGKLYIETLFGRTWRFYPTIPGSAIGIEARNGEHRVIAGYGPNESAALRDYLVELLGAPEGYVKATEVPNVEPERVYKFKVGDKVKVTHQYRNGQVGTVSEVDPKGKHYPHYDYSVKFDEPRAPLGVRTLGYNEDELEEYREPTNQEVRDALPNGSVIRFNSEENFWHKAAGKWLNSKYEGVELMGSAYNAPLWTQHVVFDPSKED